MLQNKHSFFNTIVDSLDDMVLVLTLDNDVCKMNYCNKTFEQKTGYSFEELKNIDIEKISYPLDENNSFKQNVLELQHEKFKRYCVMFTSKSKEHFPVEVNARVVEYGHRSFNVFIIRDITERYNTEKQLKKDIELRNLELKENNAKLHSYAKAMDENTIVTIANPDGTIKYANDRFYEVSGFSKEEVLGKQHNIIRHPDSKPEVFKELWDTIKSKKIWRGIVKNKKKDGGHYIVQSVIVPILDSKGDIAEYIATRYEITQMLDKQKEIEKLVRTDSLTSLPNRFRLNEFLKDVYYGHMALIDINSFHEINDFYGERIGDEVIKQFAQILKDNLDEGYELFHLQGDEFAIFNQSDSKEIFLEKMRSLNKFCSNQIIKFNEKTFYPNTTISLSFEEPHLLLSSSNLAHTFAKQKGLDFNIYSYETSPEKEYIENLKWASKVKNALIDDRITVFLQAIVDSNTKEVVKYESLVRMIDSDDKVISPYFFLDISKKSNQYAHITKVVIDKTLELVNEKSIASSINLTIDDIGNSFITEHLFNCLDKCGKCDQVTFEIVESEGIENFEEVNKFIKKVKSHGCKVAIDDFGTGYSNFEYLLKLNADIIKIDGSLIKNIDKDKDCEIIVQTIVNFAKLKNMTVVAEFVSSEEIYNKVKDMGIDLCQGFYFSEPSPYLLS